ncbi:MAG: response regulator transcription factor [Bergeyella sp.]|nr:response regulator transcription factor [Bergeyella sp.]
MREVFTCIIVDDEPAAHMVLKNYINRSPQLQLVTQCYNIPEVTEYLRDNDTDLLFLDIHVPETSGLEFLQSHPNPPKAILTTAYSQYALKSYDYGVVDYLLKPIPYPRFQKAVKKFLSLHNAAELFMPKTLTLKVDKEKIQLSEADVDYVQSLGNYVKVYVGSRFYLASTTTQEILSHLSPKRFVRIHKSFAVNLGKISHYSEKEVVVSGKTLPIGITFKRELFKRLLSGNFPAQPI